MDKTSNVLFENVLKKKQYVMCLHEKPTDFKVKTTHSVSRWHHTTWPLIMFLSQVLLNYNDEPDRSD